MPFSFTRLSMDGVIIVEPRRFDDERGCFLETFKASDFAAAGLPSAFAQDNQSRSARGVVRGLHFQRDPHAQGKLVRVVAGRAWDVAVDLRKGSPTFGLWHGLELSAENRRMVWIPAGFAHGFQALADGTELEYKCTAEYHAPSEDGLRWDDPTLAVDWPLGGAIVSARDAALPPFDPSRAYFG